MVYVITDIETTGLSKYYDKITEIAAIKIDENGIILDSFQTLINPEVRIPRKIIKLTGITNDLVKDAPLSKPAMENFINFLEDNILVAHNAKFDFGFLEHYAYYHHDIKLKNKQLCTLKLTNRLLPHLPNKKLATLCRHYNIINNQAHRAMSDVKATLQVFNRFLIKLKEKDITTPEEILQYQKSRKPKVRYF